MVTWSKQIKNVLKADPDAALAPDVHPGPETELDFWAERAANLKSIHEQLEGAAVQKVVAVLRLARSTYHPAYVRLHSEVETALTQAADNVLFLAPLRPRLEKLLHRCAAPRHARGGLTAGRWCGQRAQRRRARTGTSSRRFRASSSPCSTP